MKTVGTIWAIVLSIAFYFIFYFFGYRDKVSIQGNANWWFGTGCSGGPTSWRDTGYCKEFRCSSFRSHWRVCIVHLSYISKLKPWKDFLWRLNNFRYKWDKNEKHLKPETGLLQIRAGLGVFANLRPAAVLPQVFLCSTIPIVWLIFISLSKLHSYWFSIIWMVLSSW